MSRLTRKQIGAMAVALVVCLVLTAGGCSVSLGGGSRQQSEAQGGGQQQGGQQQGDPQLQAAIRQELQAGEGRRILEEAIRDTRTSITMDDLLKSPKGQKMIQDELKKIVSAPEMQKTLQQQVVQSMQSSTVKEAMDGAVRDALMKLVQGGTGGGKAGQGGQGGVSQGGAS